MIVNIIVQTMQRTLPIKNGLSLWLDAADLNRIVLDGSSNVSQWSDKSPNGRHFTNSIPGDRPSVTNTFNGNKRGILFDSSAKYLRIAQNWTSFGNNTTKEITEFYVVKWPSNETTMITEEGTIYGHKIYPYYGGSTGYYDAGPESTARVFGAVDSKITTAEIITAYRNGGTVRLYYGDSLIGSRTDATGNIYETLNGITLGKPTSSSAVFAEVIIYNRILSDDEILAVRKYLRLKWGIF